MSNNLTSKKYNDYFSYILKHFIIFSAIYFFLLLFSSISATTLTEEELYCNSDLVMDAESGNVLFEKNGYKKVYPASTTKILTAILAIENLDLEKSVVVSENAIDSTPYGSSVIYLKPQEVMSVKNLLYGLLLKSGNDAANVLAETVSGNIDGFVVLMNEKLKEIGCNNTHFTNAHGFHDDEHYTTAYDMAILLKYAMQNDTFRQIMETKEYTIPATNKSEERVYKNTNKMFDPSYPKMYYEYTLGGKTGYTEEARGTFVGYGKKDDKLVIVATFDGSQNINRQEGRFLDSIELFEYAFNNFNRYKILDKNTTTFKVKDENYGKEYTLSLDSDRYALFTNSDYYLKYDIDVDIKTLYLTETNKNIGTINLVVKGNSLNVKNDYGLILTSKNNYFSLTKYYKYIKYVDYIIVILLFILWIILLKRIIKENKKNKDIGGKRAKRINSINYKKI